MDKKPKWDNSTIGYFSRPKQETRTINLLGFSFLFKTAMLIIGVMGFLHYFDIVNFEVFNSLINWFKGK